MCTRLVVEYGLENFTLIREFTFIRAYTPFSHTHSSEFREIAFVDKLIEITCKYVMLACVCYCTDCLMRQFKRQVIIVCDASRLVFMHHLY